VSRGSIFRERETFTVLQDLFRLERRPGASQAEVWRWCCRRSGRGSPRPWTLPHAWYTPPPHLEALPRACSHSHRHPSPIAILAGRGRAALPLPKCCAREGSWLTCCCFLAGSQGSEATASSLSRAGLRGDRLSDRPKKWAAHLREQARVVTRARSRSSPQAALGVAC